MAQLHFKAGSIPDLAFELIFFAGKLFASLFHDRGTASPEFLWRSWLFTGLVFSGLVYLVLRPRSEKQHTNQLRS